MIDKETRKALVEGFQRVRDAFDADSLAKLALGRKAPILHYIFIRNLVDGPDFRKMGDVELAMLCGKFDLTFAAGDYGYTAEQNMAINALGDIIAWLK